MVSSRLINGLLIATVILSCLYMEYTNILYVAINFAVCYDTVYMIYVLGINKICGIVFLFIMLFFNTYMTNIYSIEPLFVLKIIFISQFSDIYQYVIGINCGINKIGYISKNKTYEGYIFGYLFTIGTFVPVLYLLNSFIEKKYTILTLSNPILVYSFVCSLVYFYGILGGLLSSLVKRSLNIKDYSDLLGPHGGWVDRIDSIILPLLLISEI